MTNGQTDGLTDGWMDRRVGRNSDLDFQNSITYKDLFLERVSKLQSFNPKKPGGGEWNVPTALSKARHFSAMWLGMSNFHVNSFYHV